MPDLEEKPRVVGKLSGDGWEARLTTDGWECDDPDILTILEMFHPRLRKAYNLDQELHLPWGVEALQAAGQALKARIFVAKALTEREPGVKY